jgi:hypothetical protein
VSEIATGSIHGLTVKALSERCARIIMGFTVQRAVTIDPDGKVWVDSVRGAIEAEIVGVYAYAGTGLLKLQREIADDLEHEIKARNLEPRGRRYTLSESEAAKRKAG